MRKCIDSAADADGFEFTKECDGMPEILQYDNYETGMRRTYSLVSGRKVHEYRPRSLDTEAFNHPTEAYSNGAWAGDANRGYIRGAEN